MLMLTVRYIPLNNNAIDALEQLRKIIKDDKRVIASKNHTIPSPRKIYRTMESILRNCGITGKTNLVHALRHTFATALIHSGVDIKAVSEILGHEDVSTTVNRSYGHTCQSSYISIQKALHLGSKGNAFYFTNRLCLQV